MLVWKLSKLDPYHLSLCFEKKRSPEGRGEGCFENWEPSADVGEGLSDCWTDVLTFFKTKNAFDFVNHLLID